MAYQATSPTVSGTTGAHRRRTVNVCARCHKRKRKCDRKFPSCSGCQQAGVECTGLNPTRNGDAPRSIVQYLEQSISKAEMQLASSSLAVSPRVKSHDNFYAEQGHLSQSVLPIRSFQNDTFSVPSSDSYHKAATSARISGIATPNTVLDEFEGLPYKRSMLLSTELPLPVTDMQSNNESSVQAPLENFGRDVRLPFEFAKRLFDVFVDKIMIQNPIFFEDDIRAHFDAVYCTPGKKPSEINVFMISMVLAISTMTSKAYEFNKIVSLSESLHREALKNCKFLSKPGIVALQGILLLMQFAELLPSTGSLWHLAGEAVSLALQLGLHQDPHEAAKVDFVSLDLRRRVFWTVYCLERSITVTSHRQFILKDEHINAEFPTEYEDSHIRSNGIIPGGRRTKLQFLNYIRFRQIQSEILAVQFFGRSIQFDTYSAWASDMENRLINWQQTALSQSEMAPDWFHHAVWQCYLMLHRPSPRNATPSEKSMMACVEAAMGLSKGSRELLKNGYLTYPFHNAHNGFEATTIILYGLKHHAKMMHNRYGNQNVIDLITSLSGLFDLLAERWPAAIKIGTFLHDLEKAAVNKFLAIPNTSPTAYSLYHPDQLELIVLHKTAEATSCSELVITNTAVQEQTPSFEIPSFSRYDSWIHSSPSTDFSFTNHNFSGISGRDPGFGNMDWMQSATYDVTHTETEIKQDCDADSQSWNDTLTVRSQSPPKERPFGLDLAKLLPSCNRCRTRRIKCEREVLECQNCIDSGNICIYKDKLLSRDIPCSYIESLQQRLHNLLNIQEQPRSNALVITNSTQTVPQTPGNSAHVHVRLASAMDDSEIEIPDAFISTKPEIADATFFGYTSAVSQMAERKACLTLVQRDQPNWPKATHRDLKDLSKQILREDPALPPKATTTMLLEIFNNSINLLYNIIEQEKLEQLCTTAYEAKNSLDTYDKQIINLILAIALQVLSKGDPSFSASSIAYFTEGTRPCKSGRAILRRYSMKSFRITLLVCIYLMLRPQAGDIWRMVAFASRLCVDIGNMTKRDQGERQAYLLMYRTLHCLDTNVSIAFGRPAQLPERPDPSPLLPKASSVPSQGRIALYYYHLTRIKVHLHDSLMKKYPDRISAHQKIESTIEECRSQLNNWSVAWNAEIDANQRIYTEESTLADLKSWGNLVYYETYLLLQRYSTVPIPAEDKLRTINSFLISSKEVLEESSTIMTRYLSDSSVGPKSYFYPMTWTFAHTILCAGLDLVRLKDYIVVISPESAFRSCITILAHLEADRTNLLDGFTQTLESLYVSRETSG